MSYPQTIREKVQTMKTFDELLEDYACEIANVEHERRCSLRDKHPEYLRGAERDLELAKRKLLAFNQKYHNGKTS